jgi:hypothetical protein
MMASPAMAHIVITIDNSVYPALVKYDRTDEDVARVRAFALDIKTDDTADINDVNDVSTKYWVHPGGINIVGGEVEQYGNAVADPCVYDGTEGGIDTNGVTIEMASLFIGESNAPPNQGVLCTLTVTSPCLVSITENTIRGGVVLEDTNSASGDSVLDLSGATNILVGPIVVDPPCYEGQPDEDQWTMAGEPNCWCYPRQCYGDADGADQGSGIAGYAYVSTDDLDILIAAWMIKDPTKGGGLIGLPPVHGHELACADFDHLRQGSGIAGYARVSTDDLDILIAQWMIKEPTKGLGIPSDCLPGTETPP